jgi:membrane associated rhomboid family serine protease
VIAPPATAAPAGRLGRLLAYRRPFRDRVDRVGLATAAPVSLAFLTVSLVVSSLWRAARPGEHRLVSACCAWRAADLPGGSPLPLLGSALLVRRPVEALWTVAATWLVLGPLEALIGSRRLLLLAALGNVVPTLLVDLCWLAGGRTGTDLAGLDVGTSGVVVTTAAALAVTASSLPVAAVLAAALAVDIAAAPGLATAEHLVAVVVGVLLAMALARRMRAR